MDSPGNQSTAPIFDKETVEEVLDQADDLAAGSQGEEEDGVTPSQDGGTQLVSRSKPFFNIIEVIGAEVPSENAKFSGNTPSVAARKAARRIWKRSNKDQFEIIMRKVAKMTSGRILYKYHAQVSGREEPIAFFAAKAASFCNADGTTSKNVVKRIHIAKTPSSPVYGCIDSDGNVMECTKKEAEQGQGVLHRTKGTNTLVLSVMDNINIPKKVGPHNVVRDDHIINVKKSAITESEASDYDVAGAAKTATKVAAKEMREKEKEKKTKAKKQAQEAARKEKDIAKKSKASSRAPKRSPMTGGDATPAQNPTQNPTYSNSPVASDARTFVRNSDGVQAKSDAVLTFSH